MIPITKEEAFRIAILKNTTYFFVVINPAFSYGFNPFDTNDSTFKLAARNNGELLTKNNSGTTCQSVLRIKSISSSLTHKEKQGEYFRFLISYDVTTPIFLEKISSVLPKFFYNVVFI